MRIYGTDSRLANKLGQSTFTMYVSRADAGISRQQIEGLHSLVPFYGDIGYIYAGSISDVH